MYVEESKSHLKFHFPEVTTFELWVQSRPEVAYAQLPHSPPPACPRPGCARLHAVLCQ